MNGKILSFVLLVMVMVISVDGAFIDAGNALRFERQQRMNGGAVEMTSHNVFDGKLEDCNTVERTCCHYGQTCCGRLCQATICCCFAGQCAGVSEHELLSVFSRATGNSDGDRDSKDATGSMAIVERCQAAEMECCPYGATCCGQVCRVSVCCCNAGQCADLSERQLMYAISRASYHREFDIDKIEATGSDVTSHIGGVQNAFYGKLMDCMTQENTCCHYGQTCCGQLCQASICCCFAGHCAGVSDHDLMEAVFTSTNQKAQQP